MRKIKLEKITGVVALSYLVLIPVGAFCAWRKIQQMDDDLMVLWDKADMPGPDRPPLIDINALKERFIG